MKKTLTANISGTVFHIEEDAYEALQRYLASIKAQFAGSPGQQEIMGDIEARIAELFTERLVGRGQVVTQSDVDHIIGVMGQPEEYLGDEEAGGGERSAQGGAATDKSQRKRLFRDLDDSWVGGVLSGLATYVGADPLWFRIAFIALVVLGVGSPILIYIILWILVPPANTAAERLMMEGEPVTVDNLKKSFEEGGKRVAKEVENMGQRWNTKEARSHGRKFSSGAGTAARGASRALIVVVGLILFLIGVGLGVSLLGTVVGGSVFAADAFGSDHSTSAVELSRIVFLSGSQAAWFFIALFVLLLVPVIGLISGGLQLMLGLRAPSWSKWILIPAWIIAFFAVLFIGLRVGRDFQRSETLSTTITLNEVNGQVLYLKSIADKNDTFEMNVRLHRQDFDLDGLRTTADSIKGGWAQLDVRRSPDADYHVRLDRTTQGADLKTSLRRSDRIQYRMLQQDSIMAFSPWLTFPRADKLRAQRLRYVVLVPVGKAVYIAPELRSMLDDVKNVTNTLDDDMVGRIWTMTPNGLSGSVLPQDVPDNLFPPKATTPTVPDVISPNETQPADPTVSQAFVMPDLLTILRQGR